MQDIDNMNECELEAEIAKLEVLLETLELIKMMNECLASYIIQENRHYFYRYDTGNNGMWYNDSQS